MAYARFGKDSDVYVYADVGGGYACERCPDVASQFRCETAREMARHLETFHRGRGDKVPDEAISELISERD